MSLRLLLVLAALFGLLPCASAQTDKNPNGVFLIATPGLIDPNFRRSVVLVTQVADGGSVGFIVNRPGTRSLAQILPENEVMKRFTEPLYLGGPVEAAGLFAMFRASKNPAGALRVLGDVSFAMDPAVVEQVLNTPPGQVRFFNGYAGWAPGQLAAELKRGGWLVLNADADTVFRKDMDTLWQELLVRARGVSASLHPPRDMDSTAASGARRDQLSGVSSDTARAARQPRVRPVARIVMVPGHPRAGRRLIAMPAAGSAIASHPAPYCGR